MATQVIEHIGQTTQPAINEVEVTAGSAWPFILAFGIALVMAGLLTSLSVSVLGVVLAVAGCAGWFREVLPHEHEVAMSTVPDAASAITTRHTVERIPLATDQVRAWLPLHTHPVSDGLHGGWAGGVAMAVCALVYGLLKGSIWFPVNLLAASVYAESVKLVSTPQLNAFHLESVLIALGLHALGSTLIGLLYGAMLPMFAKRPILLGGLIGPVLWSGLLYSTLSLLNPLLQSHIDWGWFMASQVAFGVVAGMVVVRRPRVLTHENLAFALRAGVEAPGLLPPRGEQ